MAHFAELDENDIVLRVLVIADEHESRGEDYLANELGLGGRWIQTSYNGKIRGKFAGIGDKYDKEDDVFIPSSIHDPKPPFLGYAEDEIIENEALA